MHPGALWPASASLGSQEKAESGENLSHSIEFIGCFDFQNLLGKRVILGLEQKPCWLVSKEYSSLINISSFVEQTKLFNSALFHPRFNNYTLVEGPWKTKY